MSYRVLCALGDSITNGYWDEEGLGWFSRLSVRLAKECPYQFGFNNLAMDGDTSLDVLHRLRSEALARNPDLLLIAVGVNDLIRWHEKSAPTDISSSKRTEIWYSMLELAKKTIDRVAVMSLLPINEAKQPDIGSFERPMYCLNEDIEAYNDELKKLCKQFDILFCDQSQLWSQGTAASYLYDSSHPNAKGHQLIADNIYQHMKEWGWFKAA